MVGNLTARPVYRGLGNEAPVQRQLHERFIRARSGGNNGRGLGSGIGAHGWRLLSAQAEQELGVRLRFLETGDEHFHRLDRPKSLHGAA